jgi:hypothetical protein
VLTVHTYPRSASGSEPEPEPEPKPESGTHDGSKEAEKTPVSDASFLKSNEVSPSASDDSNGDGDERQKGQGKGEEEERAPVSEQQKQKQKPKSKDKATDPLRWFGILTPLALRQAQVQAIKAVEEIIPRLATLSVEMAAVELEVRRARKRRAKAEKAEEKRVTELADQMGQVDVSA